MVLDELPFCNLLCRALFVQGQIKAVVYFKERCRAELLHCSASGVVLVDGQIQTNESWMESDGFMDRKGL